MALRALVLFSLIAIATFDASTAAATPGQTSPARFTIAGVVRDSSGGAVVGAVVVARFGRSEQQTVTGPDGHFSLDPPAGEEVVLVVRAGGFAESEQRLPPATTANQEITVVLMPATLVESITV